jgi:hypothetical protein
VTATRKNKQILALVEEYVAEMVDT